MKDSLHTDEMMHEVVYLDTGLHTARRISHVYLMEVSTYPKMLLITDAAINIYPTLDNKFHIVQNAIDLAHVLDITEPRVAILSAVETVDAKILSTIEAAALCKMADRGQISGAILDGPLAFDTAINAEGARIKGLVSNSQGSLIFWWFLIWNPAICWPSNWNILPMPAPQASCLGRGFPSF